MNIRSVVLGVVAVGVALALASVVAKPTREIRPLAQEFRNLQLPVAPQYQKSHGTTGLLEIGSGKCSATAFAPHVILTATHCVDENPQTVIFRGELAQVLKIVNDGNDHAFLYTDLLFLETSDFGPSPRQGDKIYVFGNPGGYTNLLRVGYVSGTQGPYTLLDFNGYWGDSGSAIFDTQGRIVGVTSEIRNDSRDLYGNPTPLKFMVALPFAFTPQQIITARMTRVVKESVK